MDDKGWETILETSDEVVDITSQMSPKKLTEFVSVNVVIFWRSEGVPEDILWGTSELTSRDTSGWGSREITLSLSVVLDIIFFSILNKDTCLELFFISPHSSKLLPLLFMLIVSIDEDSKETIEGKIYDEFKGRFSGRDLGRIIFERVSTWLLSSIFPLVSREIIWGVSSERIDVNVRVLSCWVSEEIRIDGKFWKVFEEVLLFDVFIWVSFLISDVGIRIEVFFIIDLLEETVEGLFDGIEEEILLDVDLLSETIEGMIMEVEGITFLIIFEEIIGWVLEWVVLNGIGEEISVEMLRGTLLWSSKETI